MGTYRFLLAILVALSHMGVSVAGLNPGVFAVISFFLISGFVMTGLLGTHYAVWSKVPLFYIDRVARIFPQYLLFMMLTLLAHALLRFESPFLSSPSAWALLGNVLVLPLDFFMFSPQVAGYMLLPQAWSLGLELMFYLLVPWLLLGRLRDAAFAASLLVWLVAAFGIIHTDAWGYRLLPGTLFMFLAGSYVYDQRQFSLKHPVPWLLAFLLLYAVALQAFGRLGLPYNREVMAGLLAGSVALFGLARLTRNRWDDWLGNLSYGVFLSHVLVVRLFEAALGQPRANAWPATVLVAMLVVSTLLAWLGYVLVERPVLRWRRRYRLRSELGNDGSTSGAQGPQSLVSGRNRA